MESGDAPRPEPWIFGENGRVMNPPPYAEPEHQTNPIDTKRLLMRREPRHQMIICAWLMAGPFNPAVLIWTALLALNSNGENFLGAMILYAIICTVGSGLGIGSLEQNAPMTSLRIVGRSLKFSFYTWFWITLVLTVLGLAGGPIAMFVLIYGIVIGAFFALPAGLFGALMIRAIAYQTMRVEQAPEVKAF